MLQRIPLAAAAAALLACSGGPSPLDGGSDPGLGPAEVEADREMAAEVAAGPDLPAAPPLDGAAELDAMDVPTPPEVGTDLAVDGGFADETGGPDAPGPVEIAEVQLPVPIALAGEPCTADGECVAGLCAMTEFGDFCIPFCGDDECPSGWVCVEVAQSQVCMPISPPSCVSCGEAGCPPAWCRDLGPEGSYCLKPCGPAASCLQGFSCQAEEGGTALCVPLIQSCLCEAKDAGKLVDCTVANEFGSCTGNGLCSAEYGLSDCDAPVPQQEKCDGKDNDCDSWVDEDFPDLGKPCDGPDDDLCMTGIHTCGPGGLSLACSGETKMAEKCDGKDNDCDGLVDEDFPALGSVCGVSPMCGYGYFSCDSAGKMVCFGMLPEPEDCDGEDNDCDGLIDEDFPDENGDGVADCLE